MRLPAKTCFLLSLALAAWALSAPPASRPASNLDYWLNQAKPADSRPASATASAPGDIGPAGGGNPFGAVDKTKRTDGLPGVAILSDGKIIPGLLLTTRDKNWEVWVEQEQRWRHIPPVLVLSITTVVVEGSMDKEWRWKEMGSDERVFTGRERPIRRYLYKFHLIDDTTLTGAVKGQPLWIDSDGKRSGPYLLQERTAGDYGQSLKDFVYLQRVVVSQRAMVDAREPIGRPG
jgi:hypothetical protein